MKISNIEVAHTTSRPGDYPAELLPQVAFLGRSNVGKSSLINSLVNRRKLARTSKAPGRTRMIHWYRVAGSNLAAMFVDLPGYGYAKVSRQVREQEWGRLIETYLRSDQPLALAVQLLDIRRDGPTDLDMQMIEWLRAEGIETAYVLTKADKLPRSKREAAVRHFARILEVSDVELPVPYSAVTGDGKHALWARIDASLEGAAW